MAGANSQHESTIFADELKELTSNINAFIDRYSNKTAEINQTHNNARKQADQVLAESQKTFNTWNTQLAHIRDTQEYAAQSILTEANKTNDWAIDHLRRKSITTDCPIYSAPQRLPPAKDSLQQAQHLFSDASQAVNSMYKSEAPKGTGGLFVALGLLGFVISSCAAVAAVDAGGAGAAVGVFCVINGAALGTALAISVLRHSYWKSDLQNRFSYWTYQKNLIDSYANSAKEFANAEYQSELKAAGARYAQAKSCHEQLTQRADFEKVQALALLKEHSIQRIKELKEACGSLFVRGGFAVADWGWPVWNDWQPATAASFGACMGRLIVGPISPAPTHEDLHIAFDLPAIVPFAMGKDGRSLLFKCSGEAKQKAAKSAQSLITRLLATTPPGKVKFTLIDPIGLGQNVGSFMQLADFDESLVSGKAWTEPSHIEQQLLELTEHMETVIQKYLRNDYESIEAYNANAGEIAEAYRILVVWDFPVNFSEAAARRLVSIAENGPRCGVYTVVISDTEKRLPYDFTPDDLERTSNIVEYDDSRGFVWHQDQFKRHTLMLHEPPAPELSKHLVTMVGSVAKTALNVQVPYDKLLTRANLNDNNWWQKTTESILEAPLGPHGANKIQSLVLGEKTAHHAIVVGRTGSGKSNLMHVIITSLALSYSPEEIELYLVDFKQGVEFKSYAVNGLPHARVIAIESEREFGMSVLDGLDRELHRRGELFRTANVNSITEYRRTVGQLSRILLLVDEFQEFFSRDDTISSQARIILDRLVRQGRSQGIHVMLGSQTLKGASDLPHSIISQMGVRIALQCTESDARQIMGDDNLVNRQLTRPGEAIYNPESGEVQANKLFQVALFTERDRATYLGKINELARRDHRPFNAPIVFEGNEPANFEVCPAVMRSLASDHWPGGIKGADAWLGEPIALRPPVAARFRRQGGSNLLIIARDEQQGVGTVVASLIGLMSQYPLSQAEFLLVKMTTADSEWNEVPDALCKLLPHDIKLVGRKNLTSVLETLVSLAEQRANEEKSHYREIFLVFLGLHRLRDLRDDDNGMPSYFATDNDGPNVKTLFAKIMREGPESGIHVIAWCDAYPNVERIDRRLIGEFAMRVAGPMSHDDSQHLIDDSLASKLDRPHRAIFFDEERPGQLEKFRPYALPSLEWIKWIGEQLRARNVKAQSVSGD